MAERADYGNRRLRPGLAGREADFFRGGKAALRDF
jgi:hypothetical protein